MTRKEQIPFGRIPELSKRSDADLLLLKPGRGVFDDYIVIRFSTRKALEAFNQKAGLRPVVFTQVPVNCVVHKHQSDSEARAAQTANR
jgi:hypothetical protein